MTAMIDRLGSTRTASLVLATALILLFLAGCSSSRKTVSSSTVLLAADHNRRGILATARGDRDTAVSEFRTALALNGSIENNDGMAANLLNLARFHRQQGDPAQARAFIDRALPLVTPSAPLCGDVAFEKARVCQLSKDFPAAELWAQKALEAAPEADRSSRLNLLGRVLSQRGNMVEAQKHAEAALKSAQDEENREEEANSLRLTGDIHAAARRFQAAMVAYEKGLAIDKELGLGSKIAGDLTRLAGVAAGANDLNKALGFYERAAEVSLQGGNKQGAAGALEQLAIIHEKLGRNDMAQALRREREQLLHEQGEK